MKVGKQIPKKDFKIWIDALRSGKYKQTYGRLHDEKGFCCLGVACDLFIPRAYQQIRDGRFLDGYTPKVGQKYAPTWLKKISKDFRRKTNKSLVVLNDGKELTFSEIADKLEEVYLGKKQEEK